MAKFFYSFRMRIIYLFIVSLLLSAGLGYLIYKGLQMYYHENVYYGEKLMHLRKMMLNIGDINVFLILFIPLAILFFHLLSRPYTKYLQAISKGIQHLAAGDFTQEVKIHSKDEFSKLANDLNEASARLKQAIETEKISRISKETLIANLAHDLRTPLTSVIGYLNLLKDPAETTEQTANAYVETAYEKAKYLEELIETLFDVSKLDLSLEKSEKTELNLQELIHQLIEELYPLTALKNKTITWELSRPLYIKGSGKELARLFENLLVNAINYGRENTEIHVRLLERDAAIQIEITNQTEAMTQEDVKQLFEMFYTVDRVRSTNLKQTGLGLYIAQTIAKRHQGDISAVYDDGCIRFTVNLPKT